MNFRQLMALAPLNDEKLILKNKSYDEVVEIAALRKIELDQQEKELDKLQKKYDELKKSSDFYENVAFSLVQEIEEKIENLEEENERLKLSLMTANIPSR